jgi:phosphoglycerate dehydrogenase-like enzyme
MTRTLITTFPEAFDSREAQALLQQAGSEVRFYYPQGTLTEDEVIDLLRGVDALIAGSEPLSRRVLESSPTLKIIARTGVGTDSIDLQTARARGVRVTITPGLTAKCVADMTMGLLLCAARRICFNDTMIRHGEWQRTIGIDLAGKALGIIGVGAIGKLVAKRARAFEMNILANDLIQDPAWAAEHEVSYVELDELLQRSDFVSLHVPLTNETRGLIGEPQLRRMKPTAFLINTARGPIIVEQALCESLREGWIAGAALDVFTQEPPRGSPLLRLENVVMTAHVGAWGDATWAAMARQAATEVVRALRGEPALYPL